MNEPYRTSTPSPVSASAPAAEQPAQPVWRYRLGLMARKLPVDFAITMAIVTIAAVFITVVLRNAQPFSVNLVFSACIGTIALLLIDGGRLMIWGDDKPRRIPFIVLVLVSIPIAQQLGHRLAAHLLGLPQEAVAHSYARNETEYVTITVLVSVGITWYFWNRGRMRYLEAEAQAEKARAAAVEKQAMQAQLQLLQAQIEPHMLFNTLANLQGLIAVDPPRAQQLLDQLIRYLRATLSSSRAETTTLAHEFSLMQAYLGLMAVRMGTRLAWHTDLPEEMKEMRIAPMLLQPLLENAIKHGLEPKIDGGRIDVSAQRDAGMLVLTVTDTGLGLDEEGNHGTQVGLDNVRDRLQAIYGPTATLDLHANAPSGAVARIRIPA